MWETLPSHAPKKREKIVEITREEVEKVAKLARLEITQAEKEAFAKQLSQILTHVEKLKQYDTKGIEPTATVLGQVNVFRDDVVAAIVAGRQGIGECTRTAGGRFLRAENYRRAVGIVLSRGKDVSTNAAVQNSSCHGHRGAP